MTRNFHGRPCKVCGEPTKSSNRTGIHAACMGRQAVKTTVGYRVDGTDAYLSECVARETAPPWVRHPVPWDCVKVTVRPPSL